MIIYDLEIRNAIPGQSQVQDVKYCEGWHDFKGMGITCIGAYDYAQDRYRLFLKDNFKDFLMLMQKTDTIAGFNNINFDNQVLNVNGFAEYREMMESKSYDILQEVWRSLGLGMQYNSETHHGYGLDDLAKVNNVGAKTGNGALAPVCWQQRKCGNVIDYCLNDVRVTKNLLDLILKTGRLKSPRHDVYVSVNRP
jgi:hypothetical protein